MTLLETAQTSFTALTRNKVRSALTMLGVIIGVFAVVTLVAIVVGFQNYITDQFNALGSNLIIVAPGRASVGGDPSRAFSNNKLALKHVKILEREVGDLVVGVTPSIRVSKVASYKAKSYSVTLSGSNHQADKILNVDLSFGRFFSKSEEDSKANVIVIGSEVSENLFKAKNPIGQKLKIDDASFEIIGVAEPRGSNFDDRIFMPFTTVKDHLDIEKYSSITMKAKDGVKVDLLMKQTEIALSKDLQVDDFSVLSQQDVLNSVQNILGVLAIALTSIAGISLLVGGIGIMNIMLVSVTERTREIGLRKALGATSKNIGLQFITESVALSVTGGLIGVACSFGVAFAIRNIVKAEVPLWAVGVAFGFSVAVGLIFGTYPALRAAKKDPIEALRYE